MHGISKLALTSTAQLSSGYKMPLLGFGVYQNYDAETGVAEALKAGYRHIDSAQAYRNEAACGAGIRKSSVPREDIFVTTKCVSKTHGYERTLRAVEESLSKFGLSYIDLFLIHDPYSGKERRLETYKALLEKRDEGKIRTVGVSNYGIHHLNEIVESGYELPAVNQLQIHPRCQNSEISQYCLSKGIVVQAYSPIMRGELDDPVFLRLAEKYSKQPAQILLRWSLQKGYSPIVKSANTVRIHSNTQLYDFELTKEDVRVLDVLDKGDEGRVTWNPVTAP